MNDRHRVLVIGTGSIGERHLRCFQTTGRCTMAICEPRAARREELTQSYDLALDAADMDAAMAFDPTAAVICTPSHLHVPDAIRLAQHGVHVLIEKPISTKPEGLDELREQVERNRVVAAVAYVHRSHPSLEQMKRKIDSGQFGKPLQLYALCGSHFPTGRPDYRDIYYSRHESGGGAIQDVLAHMVNAAEWLVGPVDRIACDATNLALDGVEVEDTVHVLARHGGVMSNFCLNQHQFPSEFWITVVCERGTCRYEPTQNRWRWMRKPFGEWEEQPVKGLTRDGPYLRQANLFLDAIEGAGTPRCSLEQAEQTLRVCLTLLDNTSALQPIIGLDGAKV